jgi:hypothetical protein
MVNANVPPQSHDNARFLNKQPNQQLYRNALAMVIFSVGIPMCAWAAALFTATRDSCP